MNFIKSTLNSNNEYKMVYLFNIFIIIELFRS